LIPFSSFIFPLSTGNPEAGKNVIICECNCHGKLWFNNPPQLRKNSEIPYEP
jgi:hypothetical protein